MGLWEDAFKQGHGAAFWYDGSQLHWGDTHYMIIHDLFANGESANSWIEPDSHHEQGIFGWVYPAGMTDEEGWHTEGPDYDIDFGTDFGLGANKVNPHLERDATFEVEHAIGYPADHVYYSKTAGHDYEPDDLLHDTSSSCFGCGAPVSDDICGNCGHENMMWWTGGGEGLQNFKGKVASIQIEGRTYSCFGFIPPTLYLSTRHHMAIMAQLLTHGMDWQQLTEAQQLWGWVDYGWMGSAAQGEQNKEQLRIWLTTDAAALDESLWPDLQEAFARLTGITDIVQEGAASQSNEEYAPSFEFDYGHSGEGMYGDSAMPLTLAYNYQTNNREIWTPDAWKGAAWKEDLQFSRMATLDKLLRVGYNSKTADAWNDAFEEPIVDEDLGNFEQETSFMTEEEKQEHGIEGPFNIDGWTVYTKDCENQYPTHDAIWMDRGKKIMAIGWQGGHGHLFNGPLFHLTATGSPYEQTTGHFRQAPSTTEPFPAGWGWHGDAASKEERNILKQVIKEHYGVDKLKDLYKSDEDAEENYFDVGNDDEIDPHAAAVKALQDLTKQQIYDIIKGKDESQGVVNDAI